MLFHCLSRCSYDFTLYSVSVVLEYEASLHARDLLVTVNDPFNVLLNLLCENIAEGRNNCFHQGYWSVVFCSCSTLE